MACDTCGCANSADDCLYDSICRNIGRIVTVFTASGGAAGSGFTGLLTDVDDDCIKLVTSLPAPPPYPFPNCSCGATSNLCGNYGQQTRRRGCCGRNRNTNGYTGNYQNPFGSCTRIPICQITSFLAAEI